jgi:hypothetical protein
MIALDPDFLGSLAPPSKLTTVDGNPVIEFARLPRLERLRIQGKADLTEMPAGADDGEDADGHPTGKRQSREEREKRKMRGKGKSLKRFVLYTFVVIIHASELTGMAWQVPEEAAQKCHRPHCREPAPALFG